MRGYFMPSAVKLSDNIISDAKMQGKALNRSIAGQIEHWARVGKIAEENPDLNYSSIKALLIALEEAKSGKVEPYDFG